jgi:hypothetical protein
MKSASRVQLRLLVTLKRRHPLQKMPAECAARSVSSLDTGHMIARIHKSTKYVLAYLSLTSTGRADPASFILLHSRDLLERNSF